MEKGSLKSIYYKDLRDNSKMINHSMEIEIQYRSVFEAKRGGDKVHVFKGYMIV